MLSCSCWGSEREEEEGEMIDDHQHQRLYDGKGVWHSVGSGRSQREGEEEGHSNEMERDLHRYNQFTTCQPVLVMYIILRM